MAYKMSWEFLIIIFYETYKWRQYWLFFNAVKNLLDEIVKSLFSFVILMDFKDLSLLVRKKIVKSKEESFRPNTFFHFLNNLLVINGWNSPHVKIWFPLLWLNVSPDSFIQWKVIWLFIEFMLKWENLGNGLK